MEMMDVLINKIRKSFHIVYLYQITMCIQSYNLENKLSILLIFQYLHKLTFFSLIEGWNIQNNNNNNNSKYSAKEAIHSVLGHKDAVLLNPYGTEDSRNHTWQFWGVSGIAQNNSRGIMWLHWVYLFFKFVCASHLIAKVQRIVEHQVDAQKCSKK